MVNSIINLWKNPPIRTHPNGSRRKFLKDVGLNGLGGFAVGAAQFSAKKFEITKKGQNIKLLTAHGRVVEFDSIHVKSVNRDPLSELQECGRQGIVSRSWVMIIDLAKCSNVSNCNFLVPGKVPLRTDQYYIYTLKMQDTPRTKSYLMPKSYQHCDNSPCVLVCPVDTPLRLMMAWFLSTFLQSMSTLFEQFTPPIRNL